MAASGDSEHLQRLNVAIVLIAGIAIFLVLGYSMSHILSPFILVAALVFLLYPLRHQVFIQRLLWLAILLFALWFFDSVVGVIAPFIISFIVAYIFNPAVEELERRAVPRWASAAMVIILFLGALVMMFYFLIPIIVAQFPGILKSVSAMFHDAVIFIKQGRMFDSLSRYGVPVDDLRETVSRELPQKMERLTESLLQGILGFLTSVSTVLTQIVNFIIVPFLSFYLLKDFQKFLGGVQRLIPVRRRGAVKNYFNKVDEMVGQYVRGLLLVSLIQGVLTAIGLMILGVEFALVLGVISGVLNLIPYVGFYSSLVLAMIVASISGGSTIVKVIGTVVLYVGLNIIDTTVLSPRIIGKRVGLHPVALILTLLIFGYFLGFVGLLIAVPATAVIIMTFRMWMDRQEEFKTEPIEPA
jgi:predicted PurR-regulated permease PerM